MGFLALLGAVALTMRLLRASGAVVHHAAVAAAAAGRVESSARRGDITGMNEGRGESRAAIAARRRASFVLAGWAGWLFLPLLTGAVPIAWAVAAPLWLLPSKRPARS